MPPAAAHLMPSRADREAGWVGVWRSVQKLTYPQQFFGGSGLLKKKAFKLLGALKALPVAGFELIRRGLVGYKTRFSGSKIEVKTRFSGFKTRLYDNLVLLLRFGG